MDIVEKVVNRDKIVDLKCHLIHLMRMMDWIFF